MSLHYHSQVGGYRYRSATSTRAGLVCEQLGSDSDVNELSDLEDDEEADEEEDGDEEDDEDDDEDDEDDDNEGLPYPGFVPVSLRYLDQTTRPRNWCLVLITNPYPFQCLFVHSLFKLKL